MYKSHKIRGIEKAICNAEQKIAYNYLFSWATGTHEKNYALSCIQRELSAKANGTYNELYNPLHPAIGNYDYDLVYHYILQSWDRYIEQGKPIFASYESIGRVVYSDYFKD